jgi:spore germination protein GerM
VQVQVGGENISVGNLGALDRPVVNPLNPSGLPFDYGATEFLPLYFPSVDGRHAVRIIRMVPKTRETATETMQALLAGPGEYGYAVRQVIPGETALRGITIDDGIATVDLSEPFAAAEDRGNAVRSVVQSLTTLPQIRGVRFLVEGGALGDRWGGEYSGVFGTPLINPEE